MLSPDIGANHSAHDLPCCCKGEANGGVVNDNVSGLFRSWAPGHDEYPHALIAELSNLLRFSFPVIVHQISFAADFFSSVSEAFWLR
jgi:hypothetical protein